MEAKRGKLLLFISMAGEKCVSAEHLYRAPYFTCTFVFAERVAGDAFAFRFNEISAEKCSTAPNARRLHAGMQRASTCLRRSRGVTTRRGQENEKLCKQR